MIDEQQHSAASIRATLLRNIGANYVGAVLNSALPLLTLPVYINILGPDNWGLVSFIAFVVSALSILDSGFNQALVREFADLNISAEEARGRSSNLLYCYELIYFSFAGFVAMVVVLLADPISSRWLNLEKGAESGIWTIYCAAALFLFQFPASIYRTVLLARQAQVSLVKVQSVFLILRHLLGVILVVWTRGLWVYLAWQVACAALETAWMSRRAWGEIGMPRKMSTWDSAAVRSTIKFAGAMAVSVLLGAATTMIDKFYISSKLPISQLGYYGVAYSAAFGLLRLSYPVFTAVLPHMVRLQVEPQTLLRFNLRLLARISAALILILVCYGFLGELCLEIWLKNGELVQQVYPVLNLLLIACSLNVFYNLGYTNWVAAGRSKAIFSINVASFCLAVVATPLAIDRFGLMGAGAALVLMNMIGAVTSLSWLLKSYMRRGLVIT